MAKPNEVLAEALTKAKAVSDEGVIKHDQLDTKYIEVLKRAGFLINVIRGWYLLNKPEATGTSSAWFVGFWSFVKAYLLDRFGKQGYCLAADPSIDLHVGQEHISKQFTVITKKASNQTIELPHDTSLLLYSDDKNFPKYITKKSGVYVMTLPLALCRLSPTYYKEKPLNVEIALKTIATVSDITRILLEDGLATDAGRLAGAFRHIGDVKKAEQIINDMEAAGFEIKEINPFEKFEPVLERKRLVSPYAGRVEALWKQMRQDVIEVFSDPPGISSSSEQGKRVIRIIQERYTQDAYHSLSIEGYEVTEELINKIKNEGWDPEKDPDDKKQLDAVAAKGYFEAFEYVLENSVKKVLKGENPGKVFENDLQDWYRNLFSASVKAGFVKASDLAGFRNGPVFIKGSRHVPPNKDAVSDVMDTLFSLLKEESHPAVRAVLGHFIFVYIHPYFDGNGRIARFLLNLMLVSGGYQWTVVRTGGRDRYMASLEKASTENKIRPFAKFLKSELDYWVLDEEK